MSVLRKVFSSKVLPSWTILLIDICIVLVSVVLAFLLRHSAAEMNKYTLLLETTFALTVVVNLVFFRLFHTYSNVLRLSSFRDVMNIFVALVSAFLVCCFITFIVDLAFGFSLSHYSVLVIAYGIMFILMAAMRMTIKMLFDTLNEDKTGTQNTFIYGTQAGGTNIAKSIRTARPNKFHLKGFIADDPEMYGKVMMGVNV